MNNKQDQLINMQITQALQGNRILLDSTPWDRGPALKFSIPFLRKQESSKKWFVIRWISASAGMGNGAFTGNSCLLLLNIKVCVCPTRH